MWQGQKDLNPRHAVLESEKYNGISMIIWVFDYRLTTILNVENIFWG